MNKKITITGIALIVGIFIFASFHEKENTLARESQQKQAEIEKARFKVEQKQAELKQVRFEKQAEIEKARLKAEQKQTELKQARFEKQAEIEKARLKAEQNERRRKQIERDKQDQECEDELLILKGKFNSATGTFWNSNKGLQEIMESAKNKKYECPNKKREFEELMHKCVNQLN